MDVLRWWRDFFGYDLNLLNPCVYLYMGNFLRGPPVSSAGKFEAMTSVDVLGCMRAAQMHLTNSP